MSRFSYEDADNYGAQKNNYFTLKDDGDTAKIRFLYNNMDDIEGVAVHEIEVNGKRMDVECLRSYNEPVEKCPLCADGRKVNAKLFIPIYDEDSKESKIWTRGRTFFQKLSSLCSHFNPLVSTIFEVERIGKKGDTSTTYETYNTKSDNAKVEDFPEINPEGIAFQVKTAEELNYYLDTGMFPEEEQPQSNNRGNYNVARGTRQAGVNRRATRETPVRRRPNYNDEESF